MTQKTIAVVYSSKYGTTKTICETIKEHSDNNTTFDLFCLDKGEQPDLNNYNHIIIGTSVYAGHPRAKVVAFCQSNIEAIKKLRFSLFVCGMDKANADKEMETAYPSELRDQAVQLKFFEGEFKLEDMKFFDKMILKLMLKVKQSVRRDYNDEVADFVSKTLM